MNKFKFKFQLLLLTLFVLTNIFSVNVQAEENKPKTTLKQYTSVFQAILSIFKSPESRFISRHGEMCLISPGNSGKQLVWSDRPLFVWRGKTVEPEIKLFNAVTNDESSSELDPVWSETIPPNIQTIAYAGEELEPGLTYEWEFTSRGKPYRQTIVLIEQSQREAISSELTALSNQLQANNATAEDMAIAKADYFLQQNLGSDALQELYSVENPSTTLTTRINEIELHLCNLDR